MYSKIQIREDFRRDGLAFNFLVDDELMLMLAKAFPNSIIQVGYPAICSEERKMCSKILERLKGENVELALSGHAIKEHLDIMGELLKPYPKATANMWIPISDYFIARTLKCKPMEVLDHALKLLEYWQQKFPTNQIDVALVDCTENEDHLGKRIAYFVKELHNSGARTVVICDTKGQSNPKIIRNIFSEIRKSDKSRIEFHPHNDNGNAIENVKVAINYDVNIIGTALLNAGERFTMIDPRELSEQDILFEFEAENFTHFEIMYNDKVGLSLAEIKSQIFVYKFITGTQYRLFNRNEEENLLFGVTSNKQILAKMLHIDLTNINSDLLESYKNRLYREKKLFYTYTELQNVSRTNNSHYK